MSCSNAWCFTFITTTMAVAVGCQPATTRIEPPPRDQPGTAPAAFVFSDFAVPMSGIATLNVWDLPDTDDDLFELRFTTVSDDSTGAHVIMNAIAIPEDARAAFVAGDEIALAQDASPVGYGSRPLGDAESFSSLVWRRPTFVRLTREAGGSVLIDLTLGDRVSWDDYGSVIAHGTAELHVEGLLGVSCRTLDGLEDPSFASPFCSGEASAIPGLSELATSH